MADNSSIINSEPCVRAFVRFMKNENRNRLNDNFDTGYYDLVDLVVNKVLAAFDADGIGAEHRSVDMVVEAMNAYPVRFDSEYGCNTLMPDIKYNGTVTMNLVVGIGDNKYFSVTMQMGSTKFDAVSIKDKVPGRTYQINVNGNMEFHICTLVANFLNGYLD